MDGCLSSQRYNFLKANHNQYGGNDVRSGVVYQVKDTIFWKQITTWMQFPYPLARLFIKSKIQFFESKSQLEVRGGSKRWSCLSSQRYNFLKANHNFGTKWAKKPNVVYQVKDTIFWKQITTGIFYNF